MELLCSAGDGFHDAVAADATDESRDATTPIASNDDLPRRSHYTFSLHLCRFNSFATYM